MFNLTVLVATCLAGVLVLQWAETTVCIFLIFFTVFYEASCCWCPLKKKAKGRFLMNMFCFRSTHKGGGGGKGGGRTRVDINKS